MGASSFHSENTVWYFCTVAVIHVVTRKSWWSRDACMSNCSTFPRTGSTWRSGTLSRETSYEVVYREPYNTVVQIFSRSQQLPQMLMLKTTVIMIKLILITIHVFIKHDGDNDNSNDWWCMMIIMVEDDIHEDDEMIMAINECVNEWMNEWMVEKWCGN